MTDKNQPVLNKRILEAFNLTGPLELLPGGSTQTFKTGNVVLKHIRETSLENNHSLDLIQWIANFSAKLQEDGFRLPKPIPTKSGKWITEDGWTAWTLVEGKHATRIYRLLTILATSRICARNVCELDRSKTRRFFCINIFQAHQIIRSDVDKSRHPNAAHRI